MRKMKTIQINETQKMIYQNEEIIRMEDYFKIYHKILEEMKKKEQLMILDIGGGGGYFARYMKEQIRGGNGYTKLKIFVIDTVTYDAWDIEDDDIEYILCDAVNLSNIFEKESFDYIFCNMFVHHLIGNNYKASANIRKNVFESVEKILKKDGKLLVTDNFNDGFLLNSISCRIVYALTTCTNPVLRPLFFRLGAHSAGSGVCMMSEKMWENLLEDTGFRIIQKQLSKSDKWSWIKKIVLLNKYYRQRCFLVAVKK